MAVPVSVVLLLTALVVAATTTVSAEPRAIAVGSATAPVTAAHLDPDPGLAADTRLCLDVSSTVEEVALSVEAGGGLPRSTLVSRLVSAEARIGAHTDAVDPRLGQAARGMRDAVAGLRRAIETESYTGTATDVVLSRIDDLDVACQARLRPDSEASRP